MPSSTGVTSATLPEISGSYDNYRFTITELDIPNARIVNGVKFPIALKLSYEPSDANAKGNLYEELSKFVYELSDGHDLFKKLTRRHGAVAIKGFNSTDPDDFSLFVQGFAKGSNLIEFVQNGIAHPRVSVSKNVTTVNRSTGFKRLYAHMELSRFKTYPSILSFFAKYPSATGGDETLTHAAELYNVINAKYPEFVQNMIEKGVYLTQTWPYAEKLRDGSVYSWTSPHSFGRLIEPGDDLETQKKKAAQVCVESVSDDYEFTEDNGMKINEHTQPIAIHPYTGQKILFSSLPTYYQKYKHDLETKEGYVAPPVTYDNGEDIPREYLEFLLDQSIELAVNHKFEKGDIVLVDNYQAYHGRTKYGDQRREVLASFWDDIPENKKIPQPYKP